MKNIKAMKEIMIKQQQLESQNAQFAAELQEKMRQFDMKQRSDMAKHQGDMATKITDMELKYSQDLGKPGIGADLNYDLVFDPSTGMLESARN